MTDEIEAGDVPTARMLAWARNSAAYRLARRMMSEKQLGDAIARKAREKFDPISPAQVAALSAAAISFGRELKILDDENFAEIRSRSAARNGKSQRAIARDLKGKGIETAMIQAALVGANDLKAGVILARKRSYGPFRRAEADDRQLAKELAAFARNGFSFDIGKAVLAMDRAEADDLLYSGGPGFEHG